jgi:hypothetical protein
MGCVRRRAVSNYPVVMRTALAIFLILAAGCQRYSPAAPSRLRHVSTGVDLDHVVMPFAIAVVNEPPDVDYVNGVRLRSTTKRPSLATSPTCPPTLIAKCCRSTRRKTTSQSFASSKTAI